MFLGLRTVIYPAPDLAASKRWYADLLGVAPYFDETFYVGFAVGGYELGLQPDADVAQGAVTYWGVDDIAAEHARLIAAGATRLDDITEVGGGIKVATVREPGGGVLGVIENPAFTRPDPPTTYAGPGR